jgi:hypothetical protein
MRYFGYWDIGDIGVLRILRYWGIKDIKISQYHNIQIFKYPNIFNIPNIPIVTKTY